VNARYPVPGARPRRFRGRLRAVKLALVLLLLLLVLVAALPVAMGSVGMDQWGTCLVCEGMTVGAMCLAILALLLIFVPSAISLLEGRSRTLRFLLLAESPYRPPRLV